MANIYKSNYTGSQVDAAIGKVVDGKLQEKLTAGSNITISGNTISASVPTIPSITIKNGDATTPATDMVAVISGETASGHTITNTKVNVATKAYVDKKSVAAVQYLGTVSNANELAAKNPDSVGDFCRVAAAFSSYHAGDLLLCKTLKTSSAAATWDVIHGEIDKDTWTANSKTAAGYVAAGGSNANKVWKTDASGNPAWRDDANTDTNTAHTHTAGTGLSIDGSGGISGNVKYSLKVASSSEIGGVKPGTTSGKTYGVAVAADGSMTVSVPWENNTDSKVTSAANHYTPSAESAAQLSVDASSTTAATWNSTSLVTGVNIQRDSKGHVTGVTVDSIKMPGNPDTGITSVEVTGTGNAITSASVSGRKMTLTKGSTFLTSHQSLADCAKLSKNNTFSGNISVYDEVSGNKSTLGYSMLTLEDPVAHNTCMLSPAGLLHKQMSDDGEITLHNTTLAFENNGLTTTLTVPNKTGILAITKDIPTIVANPANTGLGVESLTKLQIGTIVYSIPSGGGSGDVTAAGNNTFTGMNTFSNVISAKQGVISANGNNLLDNAKLNYNSITRYTNNKSYTLSLPVKTGTLATTDDIVEFSGTSKYLTTAYCRLTREATMWLNGEYGSYTCPGYLVAGYGSGSSSMNNDVVALGPGGLYKYPLSGKIKFTLPSTAGTLALTDDIKIKSVDLNNGVLSLII